MITITLVFPLIKLAKKLKEVIRVDIFDMKKLFPLIKLAKKLKDSNQAGTLVFLQFPLIKLAKKLKD